MLNCYLLKDCFQKCTFIAELRGRLQSIFFQRPNCFKSFFRWSQVFGFNCIRYTKYPDIGVWGCLKCVCAQVLFRSSACVNSIQRESKVLVRELGISWLIKMLLIFSEEVCGGTKFANVENLRPHWVLMWLLNYGWIQHSYSANLPADTVSMSMFWLMWQTQT